MGCVMEDYARALHAEVAALADGTGCANGPARLVLRKVGSPDDAHRRWLLALNGSQEAGHER